VETRHPDPVACRRVTISDELVEAVQGHDVEGVARLLAAGADPNLREDERIAPLDWAVSGNHMEVARRLLAAGAEAVRPG
jgi:ankyrin repeat protein